MQVADDAVLKALFDMVVDPAFNGGNGSWLTSPNTAIVDVRQGPPVPTRGRRLIEFPPMLDIQSWYVTQISALHSPSLALHAQT